MLVTFRSDAYANITMFGNIAVSLLKLMGHSGIVPGAILADDVPAALERLKNAIESGKAAIETNPAKGGKDDEDEPSVNLAKRAVPLIELLEASAKEQCNVMWDK